VGGAVEKTIAILPAQVSLSLNDITRTALEKSLEGAIFTLNSRRSSIPFNKTHKFFVGLSGAMSECLVFSLRKKTLRENTRPYRYHGLKIFTSLKLRFQDFQRMKKAIIPSSFPVFIK
jgi:hypothetical protein